MTSFVFYLSALQYNTKEIQMQRSSHKQRNVTDLSGMLAFPPCIKVLFENDFTTTDILETNVTTMKLQNLEIQNL